MKKVRWGIIGPGIIARHFANDMQFSEYGQLKAVASRSAERASKFADEFHIPRHYGSYDNLYKDPEVDAIYVATPHNFHFGQSAAALRSGKPVLCEKPLTHTLRETQELINISKATGNYLMEGMWTWFLPAVKKAKEWYLQGRIGMIRQIQASFGYPLEYDPEHRGYNPDLAGGVLLDMGIYTLAITRLFIPEDPLNMHAFARKAATGVDDDVNMLLEFKDAVASLSTSFKVKLPNRAYIIGDEGLIALPDFWRARECFLYEGDNLADHYTDDRKGFGFNFEIDAVSLDLMEGKLESDVVDHGSSRWLATTMDELLKMF